MQISCVHAKINDLIIIEHKKYKYNNLYAIDLEAAANRSLRNIQKKNVPKKQSNQ